jgi:hypothetical protein
VSDVRFDAEGFFFSEVDQLRYQRILEALAEQGRSVALLSPFSTLVEHYGQRLLATLRQRSDIIVETYMPGGADALLARMNKLLEPLSVDEARGQFKDLKPPLNVFVLHEVDGFEEEEATLLARFAQDLPGARVALLFLGYRRKSLPEVLEHSFRSSLRCWSIPTPSTEALSALEDDAEAMGLGEELLPRLTQLRREQFLADRREMEGLQPPVVGETSSAEASTPPPALPPPIPSKTLPPLVRWPFLLALGLLVLILTFWLSHGNAPEEGPSTSSSMAPGARQGEGSSSETPLPIE